MADREQLYQALRNADAAGDSAGAAKLAAYIQSLPSYSATSQPEATKPSLLGDIKQGAGNLAAGLVRGAGSIGATILTPYDLAVGNTKSISNPERRAAMDGGLQAMGAEPDSLLYQGGKLAGEIAGTAGVGGVVAAPLRAAGVAPRLTQAITTGGFRTGATGGGVADLGVRAAGGAINGAASAGLVDPQEAVTGAAIGGALPLGAKALGKAGQAVGRTFRGAQASPEIVTLADRASQLGIDVPADRLANSKPLNAIASGLNYVPLSGRAGTEAKMQSQLNRALSRTFGQDSDNVTMAVRKANGDLGAEFDRVLKSNAVNVDKQFVKDLADSANKASNELGKDGAGIIAKQVQDIIDKAATGQIDGQTAYNIKKTLDRIGMRNTPEAYYAKDLKKALMGALDRSLGPDEAAAFAKTRQQYGNMIDLEKLAQNGAEGNVSIARIANMKNINNKDLQELADISAQFLKPREGQHGAAQRAAAGLGIGGVVGAPALVGTMVAGRATNAALNSNALKNAVLGKPVIRGRTNALLDAIKQGGYLSAPVLGSQ